MTKIINLGEIHNKVKELSWEYQRLSRLFKMRMELEWEAADRVRQTNTFDGELDDSPLQEILGFKRASAKDRKRYEELFAKECELYGIVPNGCDRLAEERNTVAKELVETLLPALEVWEHDRLALEEHLEVYKRNGDCLGAADAIAKRFSGS